MKKLAMTLPPHSPEERADKAVARWLADVPGHCLREAFARRDIKCNGVRIAPDTEVSGGDTLCVFLPEAALPPLNIVSEDPAYVVVNKRQGMPTQGEGSVESVYARRGGAPVFACHRLDVQTGGLLLLAKDEAALLAAREAFAARRVQKTYQALVRGMPRPAKAVLRAWLRKDAGRAAVHIQDESAPGALPIETRYTVLKTNGDTSLLSVELITGRTHQIRAHLAHIGHPVLGDDKYGDRKLNRALGLRRQQLWATRLALWDGRVFETKPGFGKEMMQWYD